MATSGFYVYQNDSGTGTNGLNALWYFDMSYGSGSANYKDTTHPQAGHQYDVKVPAGLAWQVAANYYSGHPSNSGVGPFGFDLAPYTWMTFDIWSATPTEDFDVRFEYLGNPFSNTADQPASAYVDNVLTVPGVVKQYVDGGWTYQVRIPLAFFGHLGNHAVYKFFLRDNSNNTGAGNGISQAFYLDNVGFTPGSYSWIYDGGAVNGWNSSTSTWNWDASQPINGWQDASVNALANYSLNPSALISLLTQGANSLNGLKTPGYGSAINSTNAIDLTVISAGGMWKVTNAAGFALAPYTYFTFGVLPTNSKHSYLVQFYDTSGKAIGTAVDPSMYTNHDWGANSGYWTVYAIPLSVFGSLPATVGSVSIQDTSGLAGNTIYLSAPGFFD